jgi:hypothetical protein
MPTLQLIPTKTNTMNKHLPKFLLVLGLSAGLFHQVQAQTYTHPTVGTGGTYAGACMVTTCSGTYYDNGGAGGNYSANVNSIYRTFCPTTAGMCVRATFTSFSMNDTYFLCSGPGSCCDYLTIRNGPYQNAPALYNGCTASPGTVTANNSSGCLTFTFTSDGSVQLGGWAATLSCVACAAQQTGTNTDCPNSTIICSNAAISANSPGPGLISDGCGTCIEGGETYSNWYVFSPQTSGTIGFTLAPSNPADDYDFAIYGPAATNCASLGAPIRCSYSATAGNTGLGMGAVDLTEGVGGNSWVAPINVVAGQVYRLLVSHWSPPSGNYTITWNLSGGASLDCTPPLPVELVDFTCSTNEYNEIELHWTTASEVNNDYFIVEKSTDGINFVETYRVNGHQNSNEQFEYIVSDVNPIFGANYYRLSQVDLDGKKEVFKTISCNYGDQMKVITEINILDINGKVVLSQKTNTADLGAIMTQVPLQPGMYILYTTYEDGTSEIRKFVKI